MDEITRLLERKSLSDILYLGLTYKERHANAASIHPDLLVFGPNFDTVYFELEDRFLAFSSKTGVFHLRMSICDEIDLDLPKDDEIDAITKLSAWHFYIIGDGHTVNVVRAIFYLDKENDVDSGIVLSVSMSLSDGTVLFIEPAPYGIYLGNDRHRMNWLRYHDGVAMNTFEWINPVRP